MACVIILHNDNNSRDFIILQLINLTNRRIYSYIPVVALFANNDVFYHLSFYQSRCGKCYLLFVLLYFTQVAYNRSKYFARILCFISNSKDFCFKLQLANKKVL